MAWSDGGHLQRRARWALELGRVQAALPWALGASLLALAAAGLGGRRAGPLGVLLALLCLGLRWRGREWGRAVPTGLLAGVVPLLVPVMVRASGHVCLSSGCRVFCLGACVAGGLAAGVLVARDALAREAGRTRFVLAAGVVASLCGSLTCSLYGLSGVLAMAAGLAVVSAPALVLRRA